MDLAAWSSVATILSAALSLAGLAYAAVQVTLSRIANSAALAVSLSDSLRSSWSDYLKAEAPLQRDVHLSDIVTTLELMASLQADRLFRGHSGRFINTLLLEHVKMMWNDPGARSLLDGLPADKQGKLAPLIRAAAFDAQ